MNWHPVPLDHHLSAWIDRHMPDLGGVRTVNILSCERLPLDWLPGDYHHYNGLTLWGSIYLRPPCCPIDPRDPEKVERLLHELVHVRQFRQHPVTFPMRYLCDLVRYGYWDSPAEVEAREVARRLLSHWLRDPLR
jgi:hypothetical protein